MATIFTAIRAACQRVAQRARQVRIDEDAVDRLATTLDTTPAPLLPEDAPAGEPEARAAHVVAWNMVNFGSGWFPLVRKRPGLSGARSLALALHEHVQRAGPLEAAWLAEVDAATCAEVFDQPHPGPVDDLLELFARAWRDLGRLLLDRYEGSTAALVAAADHSAARLVEILDQMPLVHDVARYDGAEVPLFKRAQITSSHLARALDGHPLGRFDDLDQLTAFADNLVPHTLRMAGVLVYGDELSDRIEREDLFQPGEPAEVEIRACGLWAVELLSQRSGVSPDDIDHHLWQRGQDPAVKAVPRHRCRTPYY